jgi:hypothetical protein
VDHRDREVGRSSPDPQGGWGEDQAGRQVSAVAARPESVGGPLPHLVPAGGVGSAVGSPGGGVPHDLGAVGVGVDGRDDGVGPGAQSRLVAFVLGLGELLGEGGAGAGVGIRACRRATQPGTSQRVPSGSCVQ